MDNIRSKIGTALWLIAVVGIAMALITDRSLLLAAIAAFTGLSLGGALDTCREKMATDRAAEARFATHRQEAGENPHSAEFHEVFAARSRKNRRGYRALLHGIIAASLAALVLGAFGAWDAAMLAMLVAVASWFGALFNPDAGANRPLHIMGQEYHPMEGGPILVIDTRGW